MLLRPLNPTLVLYTSWYGCSVFCRQFRMPLLQIVVLYNSSQDILKFFREKQRPPCGSDPGTLPPQTIHSLVRRSTTPPSSHIAYTAGHYLTYHFSTNIPIQRWYQMPKPLLLMNVIDYISSVKSWFQTKTHA